MQICNKWLLFFVEMVLERKRNRFLHSNLTDVQSSLMSGVRDLLFVGFVLPVELGRLGSVPRPAKARSKLEHDDDHPQEHDHREGSHRRPVHVEHVDSQITLLLVRQFHVLYGALGRVEHVLLGHSTLLQLCVVQGRLLVRRLRPDREDPTIPCVAVLPVIFVPGATAQHDIEQE